MTGDGENQPVESGESLDDIGAMIGDENEELLEESEERESEEESEEEEEQEGEDEGKEKEGPEPTFTLKVNGKEIVVSQSELIDLGQKGTDYSQKTMAVAEERKAVEAVREQAEHIRQRNEAALNDTIARLEAFEQFAQSQIGEPPPIEWASQDVGHYLAQKELYEARKGQLEHSRQAIAAMREEAHRQRHAWLSQEADRTENELRNTLPGWSDTTLNELAQYAGTMGLTPETTDLAFVQPGLWKLLHKAKAYDALQATKAEIKPKQSLPKVAKPGVTANVSRDAQALARRLEAHRKNPSLATLGDLF